MGVRRLEWLGRLALVVTACGARNIKDVETAKPARYDADLQVVLDQVRQVVTERFRAVEVSPGSAMVRTSWQQLAISPTAEKDGRRSGRYFVRFDIAITGGRPMSS